VDEKPSIQLLEPKAAGLSEVTPMAAALTGQSHDYKRHGTTTLFLRPLKSRHRKIIATQIQNASTAVRVSRLS